MLPPTLICRLGDPGWWLKLFRRPWSTGPPGALEELDKEQWVSCIKTAPRGSAAGPGVGTCEQVRAALGVESLLHRLRQASNALAKAEVPDEVAAALLSAV